MYIVDESKTESDLIIKCRLRSSKAEHLSVEVKHPSPTSAEFLTWGLRLNKLSFFVFFLAL
jgi:hypothetical protein